ncbi:MAG: ABC transporter ATP-binding protein [Actinobacteria bacterium]|nr:ABC transporter ATP-binding protein [Actinomycetota bacterium]
MNLELRGITKRFPGVLANDHVDLVVRPGEIHGLLGENGAGKSTLMNILYGLYSADDGEILIDDGPVHFDGPADAIAAGIGMVHQHFMLIPVFTVAENVTLGTERTRGLVGLLDRGQAERDVREISERYGLAVDPGAMVEDLPVGVQQRVEIIKALLRDADLLILDEPTAVLTPQETEELFRAMRALKAAGKSIVFISHKLKEVTAISDTITVLRQGAVAGTVDPHAASERELASLMVGREVVLEVDRAPAVPQEPVVVVSDLHVQDERGHMAVDGVSLEVRAGEIVAIAGVQGNGQTELVRALTGLADAVYGTIFLRGRDLTHADPKACIDAGIAHIPEDRHRDAMVADFTIAENLILNSFDRAPFSRHGTLDTEAIERAAEEEVEAFDVRTPSIRTILGSLSGGNQQKVVVAREFSRDITLLVASQPTRGLDVGSIEYIHRRLVRSRDEGTAVLIVSSELDEVMSLGDRIAVMYRGRMFGPYDAPVDRDRIGLLMAGAVEGLEPTGDVDGPA